MVPNRLPLLRSAALLSAAVIALPSALGAQEPSNAPREAAAAAPVSAATPIDVETAARPTLRAAKVAGIVVDGRLDDPGWAAAAVADQFYQALPETGMPATERTVVRVVYDDDGIYIGAFCYDSRPYVVNSLEQDYETHDSDVFAVTLDTYLDRRDSFMWLVNPLGAVKDGQTFNDSRDINLAWEGVVRIETAKADSGWSVEMQIPWTTLRFPARPGEQQWGLQFLRRIRRLNEDDYWAPLDRREHVHKMSRAGTLTGLRDLKQGRNLYLKPYVKAGQSSVPDVVPEGSPVRPGLRTDRSFDAGFDVKWGLTPTLTLDGTYNTDFSQTEVDQEQVNLTRFSLFYPELRDFFIENSGVFTFGDVNERDYRMGSSLSDFTLFHSRRIGLSDGQPVPIVGGGRLTGTAGPLQVGFLEMQTERAADAPPENFLVARLKRNVLGNSDVGVMFTNRAATADGGPSSRSYGADANIRFLSNGIVNAYVAATDGPQADTANLAGRLSVAWRDRFWDVSGFAKQIGAGFQPTLGFVRRTGVHEYYGTAGVHPRVELGLLYELNPYLSLDRIAGTDGSLQTRELTAGLDVALITGGSVKLKGVDHFERLDAPFTIADSVTLPVGDYSFRDATATYSPSGARALSGRFSLSYGDFYDGTKTTFGFGALWRASPQLSMDFTVDHNAVRLREGRFDADAAGAKLVYAFSRKLFTSAFVQYNGTLDQLVTNLRLDLIHAPLSDLFVVLVERRDLGESRVLERTLAVKVTKLVGF